MKALKPFLISLGVALAFVAGLAGWRLAQQPRSAPLPPELEYVVFADAAPLPAFSLTDHEGRLFGPERLTGRWTLLFFGYTHCPDVCPTTLAMLKGMRERLAREHPEALKELQYYFVSLDPKRDTPASLKTYVQFFEPSFVGATGTQETITRLTRELRIAYMVDGDMNSDDYVVNHSASILIVDPAGRVYGHIGPPHTPAQLSDTFLRVRAFYSR